MTVASSHEGVQTAGDAKPSLEGNGDRSAADEASKSLSGFVARVMDQLSITAWLPALFLVGNASLLLARWSQDTL